MSIPTQAEQSSLCKKNISLVVSKTTFGLLRYENVSIWFLMKYLGNTRWQNIWGMGTFFLQTVLRTYSCTTRSFCEACGRHKNLEGLRCIKQRHIYRERERERDRDSGQSNKYRGELGSSTLEWSWLLWHSLFTGPSKKDGFMCDLTKFDAIVSSVR